MNVRADPWASSQRASRVGVRILLVSAMVGTMAAGCAVEPTDEAASLDGSSSEPPQGDLGKADVFGSDDRGEVYAYEEGTPLREATKAVAAMVRRADLAMQPEAVTFAEPPETLQERHDLCDDVRFAAQPSIASCSGFLVAPDILVTAGHCMDQGYNNADLLCADTAWVFGLEYTQEADATAGTVPALAPDDVYGCAEVLAWDNVSCSADYAVVRLDRPVVGRAPLTMAADRPALDDRVLAIGFPSGVPMKVAPGRVVDRSFYTSVDSFEATVDGFAGNSGGPIVDPEGGVRGILVCGNALPEYVSTDEGCRRPSVCDDVDTCTGMGTYAIDNLTAYLECRATAATADCQGLLPSYPECDPYAPDCAEGKACQFSKRASEFRCLATTENVAGVGESCFIDACAADALCVKPPGWVSAQESVCHTLCQSSDDCSSQEACGPIEWRYDQARVCYPQ